VPDTAQALIDQTAMILPHVKITELLLEVDEWTGFTRHFAHLKSGDLAKDKNLLADPGRRDQPGPDQDGRVVPRHDLRQAGLAASLAHPRRNLRDGAGRTGQRTVPASLRRALGRRHTSSSDGQNFRTGSKAESTGHINPKYGSPGGRSTPTSPTSTRRSTPRS
jgi:hypothetical protein